MKKRGCSMSIEKQNRMQDGTKSTMGQAAMLKKIVRDIYRIVCIGIAFLLAFIVMNLFLNSVSKKQVENTMYLDQYRIGSKTLTFAVQSYAVTGDIKHYNSYMKELNEDKNRDIAWDGLKANGLRDNEWAELEHIAEMSNGLVPLEEEAMELAAAGDTDGAVALVFGDTYEKTVQEITAATDTCINDIQVRMARSKRKLTIGMYMTMSIFLLSFATIVRKIATAMKFAREELLVPIVKVSEQMEELAQGHFVNKMDLQLDATEVGTMVGAILFMNDNFTKMIGEISAVLGKIADGNYKVELTENYVGEFVEIKNSLYKIIDSMKETLSSIQSAANQIDAGSEQLAQAATDLAQGCTDQAMKVSDVSGMIDAMSKSMEEHSNKAKNTAQISVDAGKLLGESDAKMQELKDAIGEISRRSEEIRSIIVTIEDIASQTNLLSLNASIEAARAGDAGRGFAVVAEQVKNLAEQSTQAAGETTKLIEDTVNAVDKGIAIADEAVINMSRVMDGAKEATNMMSDIADALRSESENIQKIDTDIASVSEIVNNNSAASQETAAISEEQSSQVQVMVQIMSKFEI